MGETEILFDVLELEAEDRYYIWREDDNPAKNDWAPKPAIIICCGPFAKLGLHSYTVYFGQGLADWTFKTRKKARDKALEVLMTAKIRKPFKVKHVNRKGKEEIFTLGTHTMESSK